MLCAFAALQSFGVINDAGAITMLNGHRSMLSPSPQAISHHVHMRNVRIGAADKNMASSLFSALKGGIWALCH